MAVRPDRVGVTQIVCQEACLEWKSIRDGTVFGQHAERVAAGCNVRFGTSVTATPSMTFAQLLNQLGVE